MAELKSVDPAVVGMSEDILKNIDSLVNRAIDERIIKGAVTLVARRGEIVQLGAYGEARDGVVMSPDHRFRIASMSKTIGAAALLQLQDQGLLTITDPLSLYFPAFAQASVLTERDGIVTEQPAQREPTLHDLLTMTSGVGNSWGEDPVTLAYAERLQAAGIIDLTLPLATTIGEIAENVSRLPLMAQPGERWEYSNLAAVIMGAIVEKVSGLRLSDYLNENIFTPLGMTDTAFFFPADQVDKAASVYESGSLIIQSGLDTEGEDTLGPFGDVTSYDNIAGGLLSTIGDYYRFAQMLCNFGSFEDKRILSPQAVRMLSANHIGAKRDSFYGHGWGYMVGVQVEYNTTFNNLGNGAFGWHGSWGTVYNVWPEKEMVAIFLAQVCPEGPSWKVQERFLQVAAAAIDK